MIDGFTMPSYLVLMCNLQPLRASWRDDVGPGSLVNSKVSQELVLEFAFGPDGQIFVSVAVLDVCYEKGFMKVAGAKKKRE